jgi:GntR family transcriptional regulator
MVLRRQSGRSLYEQIADQLRRAIYTGQFPPGSQLPSERELIEQFDASRNTVRLALGLLTNEGLVVSTQGRGSFVRERAPLRYLASVSETKKRRRRQETERDAFTTDVIEQGRKPSQQIEVGVVKPPEPVATRLGLAEGEAAAIRRRIQFVDDEPSALADSYYPLALVKDTEIVEPADIQRGANRVLEEIGHGQVRFMDEIVVRMPTAEERQKLGIGSGTPVACLTRTGYDKGGTPVRVFVAILPGDKHIIVYEFADR